MEQEKQISLLSMSFNLLKQLNCIKRKTETVLGHSPDHFVQDCPSDVSQTA